MDVLAVPDLNDREGATRVINLVHDSVWTLANAVLLLGSELLRARGAGFSHESVNARNDALAIALGPDGLEFLGRGGGDEQPIACHAASDP